MMADKPKPPLTLEDLLEEFPEEIKAVVTVSDWEFISHPGNVIYHNNDEAIYRVVGWAAVLWLAGRGIMKRFPVASAELGRDPDGDYYDYEWPADPLRFYLEEVREQRKLEKKKAKEKE